MGDIAGNLGRSANAVEIALPRLVDQICSTIKSIHVNDSQRFFERVDRRPEHLLNDLARRILDRQFLMHFSSRQLIVLCDCGPEVSVTSKTELLGNLDHHRFGYPRFGRDVLQRRFVGEIA